MEVVEMIDRDDENSSDDVLHVRVMVVLVVVADDELEVCSKYYHFVEYLDCDVY